MPSSECGAVVPCPHILSTRGVCVVPPRPTEAEVGDDSYTARADFAIGPVGSVIGLGPGRIRSGDDVAEGITQELGIDSSLILADYSPVDSDVVGYRHLCSLLKVVAAIPDAGGLCRAKLLGAPESISIVGVGLSGRGVRLNNRHPVLLVITIRRPGRVQLFYRDISIVVVGERRSRRALGIIAHKLRLHHVLGQEYKHHELS